MNASQETGSDTPIKTHIIWAHPRTDSLTARVVSGLKAEAQNNHMSVSELDLYRADFDPALHEADEPDWKDPAKTFSPHVMHLAESLPGVDHLVIVFPVWWYSMPAMLKGYIDRVWNYGLVYGGGKKLPVSSIRWIALVGGARGHFEKHQKHHYMEDLLNEGIAKYCGVENSSVTFLYNTIALEEDTDDLAKLHETLIDQARSVVSALA
ncbi:NAD(P)H oxidoreductase [Pseudomonas sp. 7P_10.2_Bac1]|uniref:NAD(P)H oxidoreductase n=1 Tax=Pseudomonas sp. 7P_10.2_Bac1 TaxID=2971614 RepID=UPI0021CA7DD7|nr:NAD(P)H oxidoreductase [Pseudomonas sp. 7P_10.2_Bac1]MCU1727678.1 NAD(P)H oxidoreductase [Pseudomonas sp. 7P_10.2_Bac1]